MKKFFLLKTGSALLLLAFPLVAYAQETGACSGSCPLLLFLLSTLMACGCVALNERA